MHFTKSMQYKLKCMVFANGLSQLPEMRAQLPTGIRVQNPYSTLQVPTKRLKWLGKALAPGQVACKTQFRSCGSLPRAYGIGEQAMLLQKPLTKGT
eukprot:scaffold112086_cov19-Tisochrysis_lutea.AAC.1